MQMTTGTGRVLCPFVLYFAVLATVSGTADGCPSFTPDHVVACPGDEVVFNCTVVDTAGSQTTIWSANLTTEDISCSAVHALGLNDVTDCAPNITTYLVEIDNTCYTSVLQLTVTQDMHNVVVQCASPAVQDVIGSGVLLLLEDMPLPPSTVQYTVLLYRQEHVDIVVEWQYPPDGPRVDRYTLSVSNGTDEVLTDISEDTPTQLTLPYNQNLTLSVTASNCMGTSAEDSTVYFEAGCGLPPNPTNGYVDDYESSEEGAELVYECNPGLLPTGRNISTCIAGDWVPDPAALLCSCPGSEDAFFPEYKAACPGDSVTFSCTAIDALSSQTTIWAANTTGDRCAVIHVLGSTDTCGPFTSELGTRDDENDCFASTLSVVVTGDMNNTLIECFSPSVVEVDKIGSGLLVIEKDIPLQIGDLEYNITSYGSQAVSITIWWTYPAMGPQVDEYTVTATADNLDSPIVLTDDRTRFTLTNLYYNTNYTITVTASNCNGVNNGSTLKIFERGCEVPQPPQNGTIVTFDSAQLGATITYRCDEAVVTAFGFQPLFVAAVCTTEGWDPNPAELNCTAAPSEGKSGPNVFIVGGSIVGGSILLLAAQAVMLAVCCVKICKETD